MRIKLAILASETVVGLPLVLVRLLVCAALPSV